jgi:hypothetical protein
MKGFVAAVIAAIFSLFGIHQAPTHTASTPPSAQVASAVSAVGDPFHHVSNDAGTTKPHNAPADSTPSMNSGQASSPQAASTSFATPTPTATVNSPIVQRVVERIVERVLPTYSIAQGGITEATFERSPRSTL